jgi:glycosyltransferase involved in cell wall biosynthesis
VVIPTRDRPGRLRQCLRNVVRARSELAFSIHVVDSSTTESARALVADICGGQEDVALHWHDRSGVGAARNVCALMADAELLVNVDDDVYVEPEAIKRIVSKYEQGAGWRVVAGSVAWGDNWSSPAVIRAIGFGRPAKPGEVPDFVVGAFFAVPRALAIACPWIESVDTADDLIIGSLWRAKGVQMLFEPRARAVHDHRRQVYGVEVISDLVYSNMFNALIANPSLPRALSWEVLGFLSAAKRYFGSLPSAGALLRGWYKGHLQLAREWRALKAHVEAPLPPPPEPE